MMFNVHLSLLGWKEREALALINDGNIVNGYQSTSISTLKDNTMFFFVFFLLFKAWFIF